jgi:peptidylprolyl isomerase
MLDRGIAARQGFAPDGERGDEMGRVATVAAGLVLTLSLAAGAAGAAVPTWKPLDPDTTLVIDTTKGRMVVELAPLMAPDSVAQVKRLAHEHFYDGLKFWRVIDHFMAQTGDPGNVDGGKSSYPNLKPEFTFRRDKTTPAVIAARPGGWVEGFIGSVPFAGQPDAFMASRPGGKVSAWGLYCPGVAGMGRDEPEDSGNSEIFLMRDAYPSLDKRYTVWGRVVRGLEVVRALKLGEPAKDADIMIRVRVMADLPANERPTFQVMNVASAAFHARIEKVRKREGADFSVCDVDVPTRGR